MRILYTISIYLYALLIKLSSLFNSQASKWLQGRKHVFEDLTQINKNEKIAWFHAASLGEFEQGRPVMELFKQQNPHYKIILTFFSPSGYEIRKNYEHADYVFYLPLDSISNAKRFVELVNPQIVFFIKYEFWFNYLSILKNKKIPVYIFSAIFRPNQYFFKWYGAWFKKQLRAFDYFFVQNSESMQLLNNIGFTNVSISGDTRFDRVNDIATLKKSFPLVEQFKGTSFLFVAGSTWKPDELILSEFLDNQNADIKLLIAPHHVDAGHIAEIKSLFKQPLVLFSEANEDNIKQARILVIDSIGILFHLYQYASFTYIGGGFGKSIHNTLEAATFSNPIVFGPNYYKFQEAKDLVRLKGAFCIKNTTDLSKLMDNMLHDSKLLKETSNLCRKYVVDNLGATQIILNTIKVK